MTEGRRYRRGWAGAALIGAALVAGGAPARGGDQIARFASRTDLVVLSAIARDKHGRPVTDLRRNEFYVREDGRPQAIQHFSEGRESRARVLLLVDASGSMVTTPKSSSPSPGSSPERPGPARPPSAATCWPATRRCPAAPPSW